jgi:hypothetical protein
MVGASDGSAVGVWLRGLDEVVSVKVRRDFGDGFRQSHRKSRSCRLVEVRRSLEDVSDAGAEQLHKDQGMTAEQAKHGTDSL